MFYPEEVITEVRLNNDIVDVISEYIKLEKRGQYYFGLCPFHGEKTSSFSVTPSMQIYHCFGCKKSGNVIRFIMDMEGLSFLDAVKYLAERVNYQLPEGDNEAENERQRKRKKIIDINTIAARYYYKNLFDDKNKEALEYLKKRQLSLKYIKRFGIGYSSEKWNDLYDFLNENNCNREDILNSGLVLPNKKGGYYDRFRKRIMFPIIDVMGNVIGFGGRNIDDSLPKYMNSPETILYNKKQSLYNLNLAKKYSKENIIIVEGYMDVVSLFKSGVYNVVASLGTSLTDGQARLLKHYSKNIIIAYDSDSAGQMATLRGIKVLERIGVKTKIIKIPDGKDPDEFIKKNGVIKFNKLIENAITSTDYKISVAKKNTDDGSTEGKVNFLKQVSDILSRIDNRVELEMYINKISKEYNISVEAINTEISKLSGNNSILKPVRNINIKKNIDRKKRNNLKYEEILLCLLCLDNKIFNDLKDKIYIEDFKEESNKKIAQFIFDKLLKENGVSPAELLDIVDEEIRGDYSEILNKNVFFENNIKAANSLIDKIKYKNDDKRREEIINLLNQRQKNNLSEGDVKKLIEELNIITRKMKKK
jgi:DNA primase